MCGNHDVMVEEQRELFLTLDQDILIKKFSLENDENFLYMNVYNTKYRIDRKYGFISGLDNSPACHDIKMGIYNVLTFSKDINFIPAPMGKWESLTQLGGMITAGHAEKLHSQEVIAPFIGNVDKLREACEKLGGTKSKGGDVSYVIPVFDFCPIWFQFWDADDEFPASISFLWDHTILEILHFEITHFLTVYLENLLTEMIK